MEVKTTLWFLRAEKHILIPRQKVTTIPHMHSHVFQCKDKADKEILRAAQHS